MKTTWRHGLYLVLHGVFVFSTTVHAETTTTSPGICGPLQLTAGSQPRYLSSPGYPDTLQSLLSCEWEITAKEGERVRIVILDYNVINLSDCKDGYVKIFDGINSFSTPVEVFCMIAEQNLTITSSARSMRIELKTDIFVLGRGFEFMYYSGGDLQVQRHYDVTDKDFVQTFSPGYPAYYEGKYHITWRIETISSDKIIQMIVKESNLPYNHKCGTDYMEAHDGYDSLTPSLAKWCGDQKPSKDSTGTQMFIVFHASSAGSTGVFQIDYYVVLKPHQEPGNTETTTILLSCIAVVLVLIMLFSLCKIYQRRNRRSSHTNRAFVATTMSSNPGLQVPSQAAAMPSTETGGEIELPPYPSVAQSQPPPSYESLEFGPINGKL